MEVGIVQNHTDGLHLLQLEQHRPLHQRAAGNPGGGGVIELARVTGCGTHITAQDKSSLGLRVNLTVWTIERGHQQDSAFERARISGRGCRNVDAIAGPAEGRQRSHDKDRRHILDLHVAGTVRAGLRNGDAHAFQGGDQCLCREDGLRAVAGSAQANNKAITDKLVIANALNGGYIFHTGKLARRLDSGQVRRRSQSAAARSVQPKNKVHCTTSGLFD